MVLLSAETGKYGVENFGQRMVWRLQVATGQKQEAGASDIKQKRWEGLEHSPFRYEFIDFSVVRHSGFLSSKGCSEACRSIRSRDIAIVAFKEAEL